MTKSNIALRREIKTIKSENIHLKNQVDIIQGKVEVLNEENSQLSQKLQRTSDEIKSIETLICDSDDSEIKFFDEEKGKFRPETRLLVMDLISAGVSFTEIPTTLMYMCKFLGKNYDRLPNERTVRNINDEMLILSQTQIKEKLTESKNTSMYTDETSKFCHKYCGYHISDKDSIWVLGLREFASKSAQCTLDTLKQILGDIDECPVLGKTYKLITEVRNTMSDRASTETKFNTLFEEYRQSILPEVVSGWENFSEDERAALMHVNHFFCGLHLLVGFAETSEKVLANFEKIHTNDSPIGAAADSSTSAFCSKSESACTRLIRTCSKAFVRGVDEKNGCYLPFQDFLRDKPKSANFVKFKGNRFNVLFVDGEMTYYLANEIVEFLEDVYGPPNKLNKLLQAIRLDIKEPLILACSRVLGLISKLVTAPLWRLLERDSIHILEMNDKYHKLQVFLHELASNPEQTRNFLAGQYHPFDSSLTVEDEVYNFLTMPGQYPEVDDIATEFVPILATALEDYLKNSVEDHLPGGKFHNPSPSLIAESKSCRKHNKFPERIFAILDNLMRKRPNASAIANEAFVMFTNNKTREWLDAKPEKDRKRLITDASVLAPGLRQKYKIRVKEIANSRKEALEKKREEIERKRGKELKKKQDLTDSITYYGLLQRPEAVDALLHSIRTKGEKEQVLKNQIEFRRVVLNQTYKDNSVFHLTVHNKQKVTLDMLTQNLKTLIAAAYEITHDPHHPHTQPQNPIIVGKVIEHRFQKEETQELYWVRGYVISQVPGFPSWFNVKYEEEEEAVYSFKLLDDYQNGDLKIGTRLCMLHYSCFVACYI